jgi:hypothetical protein
MASSCSPKGNATSRYLPVQSCFKIETNWQDLRPFYSGFPLVEKVPIYKRDLRLPSQSNHTPPTVNSTVIIATCLPWRPSDTSSMEEDSTWYPHKLCQSFLPLLGHLGFFNNKNHKADASRTVSVHDEWSEIYFYGASKKIAVEEN